MTLFVDLDGVICTEERTFERSLARPIDGAREALTQLIALGHTVVIYTARSWSEYRMTVKWLADAGIPYHGLQMDKPSADLWIDDRAHRFTDWRRVLDYVQHGDDASLYALRRASREFVESVARRSDLLEPIVEVGAMNRRSKVFERMPDTYVDSRVPFAGRDYRTMDIDAESGADHIADLTTCDIQGVGTLLAVSVLEHIPNLFAVPAAVHQMLRPGGRAFFLTPWNLRFHGPRPDCWRISDDGYRALFGDGFEIEDLSLIEGDTLNPIAVSCTVRRR